MTKQQTRQKLNKINQQQIATDRQKIQNIGKGKDSVIRVFDMFCKTPEMDITTLATETNLTRPTLKVALCKLENLGIIFPVYNDKIWGQRYRYGALVGTMSTFKDNTIKTQNKKGIYLYFDGRESAERLANTPATKRFKPDNIHNNATQHQNTKNKLFIGDNLDVMKTIMPEYQGSIDLVYMDILYNMPSTREKQAYDDNVGESSEVLSMLFPRLLLAQKLLNPTGLLALSVRDNEQANVKILLDEIFSKNNFVNAIVIETAVVAGPVSGYTQHSLPSTKEYLLVYAKDKSKIDFLQRLYDPADKKFTSGYNLVVDDNLNKIPLIDFLTQQEKTKELFTQHGLKITLDNISKLMDYDVNFEDYMYQNLAKNIYKRTRPFKDPIKGNLSIPADIVFEHDGKLLEKTKEGNTYHLKPFYNTVQEKEDGALGNALIRGDVWDYRSEKNRIQKEGGVTFSAGKKSTKLIRDLLKWIGKRDAIVLDVFAGSGTTAESVQIQNKCDGGNRNYILCQIPEPVNPSSKEAKAGFKTIDQITLKRLNNIGASFQIYR